MFTACDYDGGSSGGSEGYTMITISAITGVIPPACGQTPVTTITETPQFAGAITWSPVDSSFEGETVYTATIMLSAKSGYSLTGVTADFFTVAGATSVSNDADSGVVTAVFPATAYAAGDTETCIAAGVAFVMVYVPGGLTFPTGVDDDATATVGNAYWIGETEVTYALWSTVYGWATTDAGGGTREDGGALYIFTNEGAMGDGTGDSVQHPVTSINWYDAMTWCNALTEWCNAQAGAGYQCVYTYVSEIIRDSTDTTACGNAEVSATAKGFRLLSSNEWELAARYRDGTLWTYGDHASGDDTGACYDDGSTLDGLAVSTVFGNYAVYTGNSGSSTAAVRRKTCNALGLYNMSGNVCEWCFDKSGTRRVARSGSWEGDASGLRVGDVATPIPGGVFYSTGFRFARSQ